MQVIPLVRKATGDRGDADVRAGLLSTSLLGTVLSRYILRLAPVVAMDVDELVAAMAPVLQHCLTGLLTDDGSCSGTRRPTAPRS